MLTSFLRPPVFDQPPYPASVLLQDAFTGTDTTNLTAHTMDVGGGWTAQNGSITIVSNKATCQSATNTYTASAGSSDVKVTCKFTCGAANANQAPTIVIRGVDGTHYDYVYFSGDGNGLVRRLNNTTHLTMGTFQWTADTSEHTVVIYCIRDVITVQLDGGDTWKFIISTHNSGTLFGIRGFVASGSKDKFDDFLVESLLTSRTLAFPTPLVTNTFTDNFTQTDGTTLASLGWTAHNGTWEVNSNKARQTGTAAPTNGYLCTRDAGTPDHGVEVAITTAASGGFIAGLAVRFQDLNNYIEAELNTTNGATGTGKGFALWYTINGGAYIELASTHIIPAVNTTYTMRVKAIGDVITAELVESGLFLQCRTRFMQKATKVGLFEFRNSSPYSQNNAYDNFKIYTR